MLRSLVGSEMCIRDRSVEQLSAGLRSVGLYCETEVVAAIVSSFDRNGEGLLAYGDFVKLVNQASLALDMRKHGPVSASSLPEQSQRFQARLQTMRLSDFGEGPGVRINHDAGQTLGRMRADREFNRLDTNGDGVITEEEFIRDGRPVNPAERRRDDYYRRDRDFDRGSREFDRLDRNGDGVLTEEEFARDGRGYGGGVGRRPRIDEGYDERNDYYDRDREFDRGSREFERMDRNGDGVVTEREFKQAVRQKGMSNYEAEREFDRMDRNGDGVIDQYEYKSSQEDRQLGDELDRLDRNRWARARSVTRDRDGARDRDRDRLQTQRRRSVDRDREVKQTTKRRSAGQRRPATSWMSRSSGVGTKEQKFNKMDRNRDGRIDRKEFEIATRAMSAAERREATREFNRIDRDKDGSISKPEFKRMMKRFGGVTNHGKVREFGRMDKNRDGVVTAREFKQARKKQGLSEYEADREFDRLDRNGDGVLTEEEFARDGRGYGGGVGRRPRIDEGYGERNDYYDHGREFDRGSREFERMDRNGDGVVTEREFKQAVRQKGMSNYEAEREFDRMDRNGDGVIDQYEYGQAQNPPGSPSGGTNPLIQHLQQEISKRDAEISQYMPGQYAPSPVQGSWMQQTAVPQYPDPNQFTGPAIAQLQSSIQLAATNLQMLQQKVQQQVPNSWQPGSPGYASDSTTLLHSYRDELKTMLTEASSWRSGLQLRDGGYNPSMYETAPAGSQI
eukprot:TRINITY_DN9239_c0_g1_i1.p1 TRINITY_DN9239_c0_g1~~TRINITY_DN9239_c0_g1_i1.p1  ORF type:complete len:751 (-),score=161.88 TRINITY_DN9239_c0_g1_i1:92-2290(-)